MSDSWNPGFPVIPYQKGMDLPKSGTYFIVAGNGTWMHKDTGLCRCFVPVDNISFLDELDVEAEVSINLPKIPTHLVWQIKKFFSLVFEKYTAEAEVTLYFNQNTKEYRVHVPEQKVSHTSVHYKRLATTHIEGMENFLRVGSIHCHSDFDAFHSGTDVSDEEDFDGLHVTFGNNDQEEFTVSATIVVNGFRKTIDPLNILDGLAQTQKNHYIFNDKTIEDEWSLVSKKWLMNVNSKNTEALMGLSDSDLVNWSDDMHSVQLKSTLGEGPFRLISRDKGKIIIETLVGPQELSEHFFKHHKS
jgi:PRTRC genetic system protein A